MYVSRRLDFPSAMLAFADAIIVIIGVYFIVLRPPLLPEDLQYLHTSKQIYVVAPGLVACLRYVFRVAGAS